MIIIKLISGLGNQLFQYAIGRELAIRNNVPLKLDISFFGNQNLRSFKLNNYTIQAEIANASEIKQYQKIYTDHSLTSKIQRKLEKLLPRTQRKVFKEKLDWQYEPSLFNVSRDIYIEGYWQNYRYFQNINPRIYTELTLKNTYTPEVQATLDQIYSDNNSVSIHLRRGDYITDKQANSLMGVLPLSYYYNAINHIKKTLNNPTFYFFSDDLQWVKNNLKIKDNCYFVNGKEDYVDLDLMSKCKHNIIANSSFSWFGAFLNSNSDKIVIGPKQWVVNPEMNSRIELLFPSWIKI